MTHSLLPDRSPLERQQSGPNKTLLTAKERAIPEREPVNYAAVRDHVVQCCRDFVAEKAHTTRLRWVGRRENEKGIELKAVSITFS